MLTGKKSEPSAASANNSNNGTGAPSPAQSPTHPGNATTASLDALYKKDPDSVKQWIAKAIPRSALQSIIEADMSAKKAQLSAAAAFAMADATAGSEPLTKNKPPEKSSGGGGNFFEQFVKGTHKRVNVVRKTKTELLKMNQTDMFMELIRDIANELDVDVLCHKILTNVSILTQCDRGSMFLARGTKESKYLVSKLFDVTETSTLEEVLQTEDNHIQVPFGRGIVGTVALTKMSINIRDAYQDARFNKDVDKRTGYRTRNILCMPILDYENEVMGAAQIINKMEGGTEFSDKDEEVFKNYLTFAGIGLTNAQMFEMSVGEFKQNQLLLTLAKGIFSEQTSLEKLVQRIMLDAQDLIKCLRCSVYLVNAVSAKEIEFLKVFEMNADNPDNIIIPRLFFVLVQQHGEMSDQAELKKARSAKFARAVALSAQPLNIADAVADKNYGAEIEDYDQFRIKSLLSVPITNGERRVIGVVQMMNKANGKPFTESDSNTVETFAIFCGLGVHNCQLYENVCKLMARQKVAIEVLAFHAMANIDDTEKLVNSSLASADDYKVYDFDFTDLPFDDFETCKIVILMFMELNIVDKFRVDYRTICQWTLTVKKNYRPVLFHNWRHALNTMQSMFCIMCTCHMSRFLDDVEIFGLLVASLCHDLDHRGQNDNLMKPDSPLATIYGGSLLQHHHFDQCVMILSGEGNNIFINLQPDGHRKIMTIIESAIISTDMSVFMKKKKHFAELLSQGEKHWGDPYKKDLLRSMLMVACFVSSEYKPWEVQFQVSHLVMVELFSQVESTKLSEAATLQSDRKKQEEFPKLQISFLDGICIPVYQLLVKVESGVNPLYQALMSNKTNWVNQVKLMEHKDTAGTSLKESTKSKAGAVKDTDKKETKKAHKEVPKQVNNDDLLSILEDDDAAATAGDGTRRFSIPTNLLQHDKKKKKEGEKTMINRKCTVS